VLEVENAFIVAVGWFPADGSRAIPKQHAGGGGPYNPEMEVITSASDDQRFFLDPHPQIGRNGQGVEKSEGRRKIESGVLTPRLFVTKQAVAGTSCPA